MTSFAPVTSTGIPTPGAVRPQQASVQPTGQPQAAVAGNAAIATSFGPPVTSVAGGGFSSAIKDGIGKIVDFAQRMKQAADANAEKTMTSDGKMDPLAIQKYTSQMSVYEMTMQMAAKVQDSEKNAAQVWLR